MDGNSVLWLNYAGLGELLGGECWGVFYWLALEDVRVNGTEPDVVKVSLGELGKRFSSTGSKIRKCVKKLVREGLVTAFVPDNNSEEMMIKIVAPLETPVALSVVRVKYGIEGECRYSLESGVWSLEEGGEGSLAQRRRGAEEEGEGLRWLIDRWMAVKAGMVSYIDMEKIKWVGEHFTKAEIMDSWEKIKKKNRGRGVSLGNLMIELEFWKSMTKEERERRAKEKGKVEKKKREIEKIKKYKRRRY